MVELLSYLREIVGADAFGAIPRPNLRLSADGELLLLLLPLPVEQSGPEHLQCLSLVLVLGALVLHQAINLGSMLLIASTCGCTLSCHTGSNSSGLVRIQRRDRTSQFAQF